MKIRNEEWFNGTIVDYGWCGLRETWNRPEGKYVLWTNLILDSDANEIFLERIRDDFIPSGKIVSYCLYFDDDAAYVMLMLMLQ